LLELPGFALEKVFTKPKFFDSRTDNVEDHWTTTPNTVYVTNNSQPLLAGRLKSFFTRFKNEQVRESSYHCSDVTYPSQFESVISGVNMATSLIICASGWSSMIRFMWAEGVIDIEIHWRPSARYSGSIFLIWASTNELTCQIWLKCHRRKTIDIRVLIDSLSPYCDDI
jgi:hypothetical protein